MGGRGKVASARTGQIAEIWHLRIGSIPDTESAHWPKDVLMPELLNLQSEQNLLPTSAFVPRYFPITSIGTVMVLGGMQAFSSQAW